MIKRLLLSILLLTNAYQILASDSCTPTPRPSKEVIDYIERTNTIYASHCTILNSHKERVIAVCKNLTTGEFKASETLECTFTGKHLTHFVPCSVIVEILKAKINNFESRTAKK